ncbi:MAG: sialidase family protein [Prolixibacteraceae bacterium]
MRKGILTKTAGILIVFLLTLCSPGRSLTKTMPKDTKESKESYESMDKFLGNSFFSVHKLWDGRGGPKIVSAKDGTILALNGRSIRQSKDGGKSWLPPVQIADSSGVQIVVNEINGEILLVSSKGFLWRSKDHGETWNKESITILPNEFGHGSPDGVPIGLGAFQAGITLLFGEHKGRLLVPGRIFGPKNSNDNKWRPYHYNTSMYSDDNGHTWQTSAPFPVLGTGEAALAEISNGRILYSSREHMTKGNRFFAWSDDGGATWLNPFRSEVLPDGVRGTSYGCMGGLVRIPVEGKDILLYSNLDSDAGQMPKEVGGSISVGREKVTVWASFDGGTTWPIKRLIFNGPSAYSSLGVGRANTLGEGKIFLLYEGGEKGMYSAVNVAVFNLSWLLNGQNIK